MKICIYGAGELGKYVYKQLKDSTHIKMIFWIDNYSNFTQIDGIDVISESVLFARKEEIDCVFVAIKDDIDRQRVCLSLKEKEIRDVYILNSHCLEANLPVIDLDGNLKSWVMNFETTLPMLPYLEFQVADNCNLNCKSCAHFSNAFEGEGYPDIEEYEKSLKILSNKFANIKKIRLMGGEPLLNHELPLYINLTRRIFPLSDIRIVTNGLCLLSISDELKETMRGCNAGFDVSQYPVVCDRLDQIIDFLEAIKVRYYIEPLTTAFWIRTTTGDSNPEEAFHGNACSKSCTFLRNNHLFACPQIPLLYENKDRFEFSISKDEFISSSIVLDNEMIENGWDILRYLSEPKKMCRFCATEFEWTNWEAGYKGFDKMNYLIEEKSNG